MIFKPLHTSLELKPDPVRLAPCKDVKGLPTFRYPRALLYRCGKACLHAQRRHLPTTGARALSVPPLRTLRERRNVKITPRQAHHALAPS
jgi:hypothetical protein